MLNIFLLLYLCLTSLKITLFPEIQIFSHENKNAGLKEVISLIVSFKLKKNIYSTPWI